MNTRTGKIARLPLHLRDQLNQRLRNGETAKALAVWLNSLPEVQAVLAALFAEKPISPQNLSAWKHGGYHDWLLHQESLAFCPPPPRPGSDPDPQSHPSLPDLLANVLAARYAQMTRSLSNQDTLEHWRRLREICADVSNLRRADHRAQSLSLARASLSRRKL